METQTKKTENINLDKLEELTENINSNVDFSFLNDLEIKVDDMEREQYSTIRQIVLNNIEPKNPINQRVNSSQKVMRKIGQKFFNLFKVTFTVEFAGVTLIHFTIPKVDENGNQTPR